jgi:hypothetical protein
MLNIKCNVAAIAAITLALSLPVTSQALAHDGGEQAIVALKQHAAKHKIYNTAQDPSAAGRRIGGPAPKVAPAGRDFFAPPQEGPDFNSSNGG